MVCPVRLAQPWFPMLRELTCDIPLLLHPSSTLLVSPKGEPQPLLKTGALQLFVWMLSGDSSTGRSFRNHWSSFSWTATGIQHFRHKSQPRRIGVIGVFNGVEHFFSVSLNSVLEFLAHLYQSGRSYSTININRLMLSKILPSFNAIQ
jgi:hypothetical protein